MYWFIQRICTQHLCADGLQPPSRSRCGASWSQSDWVHIPVCISLVVQVQPIYLVSLCLSFWFWCHVCLSTTEQISDEMCRQVKHLGQPCVKALNVHQLLSLIIIWETALMGEVEEVSVVFSLGVRGKVVKLSFWEKQSRCEEREFRGLEGIDWNPHSWSGTRLGAVASCRLGFIWMWWKATGTRDMAREWAMGQAEEADGRSVASCLLLQR